MNGTQLVPVVVTHALRTPIGRYLGTLSGKSPADLGTSVVQALLERSRIDPARVGELVFGNARQAGGGPNVARQISVRSGIPETTPAWTVNMACGSGLKALALAVESVRLGRAEVAVGGGTESMSGLPFLLPDMRKGYRLGHAPVVDAMVQDGFLCPLAKMLMGETAERLARELDIPRSEQDRFALESQRKAAAAQAAGRFEAEIAPVRIQGKGGETLFATDEHVRADATIEGLAKLPAVTVPFCLSNTAGSFFRLSIVVSGRTCSSAATTTSPFLPGTVTGAISSWKRPASIAAAALRWLSSAKRSCSSREMPISCASFSAVSPISIFASGQSKPSLYMASTTGAWPRR